jgi:hypothetical protein
MPGFPRRQTRGSLTEIARLSWRRLRARPNSGRDATRNAPQRPTYPTGTLCRGRESFGRESRRAGGSSPVLRPTTAEGKSWDLLLSRKLARSAKSPKAVFLLLTCCSQEDRRRQHNAPPAIPLLYVPHRKRRHLGPAQTAAQQHGEDAHARPVSFLSAPYQTNFCSCARL